MNLMTAADVAERFLRHPEPTSRAAAEKVRRLVGMGLPACRDVRPMVFDEGLVADWFRERAADVPPSQSRVARRRSKGGTTRGRKMKTKPAAPMAALLDQIRGQ